MKESKFISFLIEGQAFCVDIMAVREIRGWVKPTPIPHAPSYVCGVINLRGTVLPIIDLGARLGMSTSKPTASTVIIVAQIEDRTIGLMVDAVSDILSLQDASLQPTPDVGSEAAKTFFKGLVALDSGMIRVLNLEMLAPSAITPVEA